MLNSAEPLQNYCSAQVNLLMPAHCGPDLCVLWPSTDKEVHTVDAEAEIAR